MAAGRMGKDREPEQPGGSRFQRRTQWVVGIVMLLLAAGTAVVFRVTLWYHQRDFERRQVVDRMEYILAALRNEHASLCDSARHWQAPAGPEVERADSPLARGAADLLLVTDAGGAVVQGLVRDQRGGQTRALPPELAEPLARALAAADGCSEGAVRGLLLGPFAMPLLAGWHREPEGGRAVLIARNLRNTTASQTARALDSTLQLEETGGNHGGGTVMTGPDRVVAVQPAGDLEIRGVVSVRDPFHDRAMALVLQMPREGRLRTSIIGFATLMAVVMIGYLCVVLTLLMLQRWVFRFQRRAVSRLRNGLESIADGGDLSRRLDRPEPRSEFGELSDAINAALAALEMARAREKEQLVQIQHADRLASLGTLVSGFAHEISNPNNVIRLNAPLLHTFMKDLLPALDRHRDEHGDFRVGGLTYGRVRDELVAMLEGIAESSDRIEGIVAQLKAFARRDGNDERQPVSVNDVVEGAVRLLQRPLAAATTRFTTALTPGLPMVAGDSRQLSQVVVNLLQNARQALRSRDEAICVRTGAAAGGVVIEVKDQGAGMNDEQRRRAKEPFFTTKPVHEGTGLGLSVSDGIIAGHGGRLEFVDEAGWSTVVRVTLPA